MPKNPKQRVFPSTAKRPQTAVTAPSGKHPVVASPPATGNDAYPSWRFSMLDRGGDWGWDEVKSRHLDVLHEKLCSFETMQMGELLGAQKANKAIPTENLPRKAQKRLEEIERDDEDGLVELRLGGPIRVWGFRRDAVIYLLWWDPHHTVFP